MTQPLTGDDPQAVFEKVAEAISKQSGHPAERVQLDSKFEDLGIDSLDATEILFELEDELDVDIPNDDARGMQNVQQVVDGLCKLLRGEGAAASAPTASDAAAPAAATDPADPTAERTES